MPTPVQAQAIPPVMEGLDLLACAQTGTGKTAAFSLPMLSLLLQDERPRKSRFPRALVISPTRELAQQIADNVRTYTRFCKVSHELVMGGVPFFRQVKALQQGRDVVIGTPGRMLDLIRKDILRTDDVQFLVLDEADRMLDMGFIDDIREIAQYIPGHPQTLLFSATMPPAIRRLADDMMTEPAYVEIQPEITTAQNVTQQLLHVRREDKQALLEMLLQDEAQGQTLIFTRTKAQADKLADKLNVRGYRSEALHGDIRQSRRLKVLKDFRGGYIRILVATDVAARGLDIKGVDHVINYDLPNEPETYVHRIGRTGRAGASGIAISFCDRSERTFLRDIERTIKQEVPVRADHPFAIEVSAERLNTQQGGGGGGFRQKSYRGGGFRSGGGGGGGRRRFARSH
ncbi:MAG: DEAD/DEAH box helicase [Bacteroidetes bacterium]|nr:DEAD/DEAH box helicase [Bacteroidota bacterium]